MLETGAAVATLDCRGDYIRGGYGTRGRTTYIGGDCHVAVPAQGADAMRITARAKQAEGSIEYSNPSIGVRITPPSK